MNFAATFAAQGLQSEYAVGVLVSMMVGQNLIASALGLASGLTEALLKLVRLGMGHNGERTSTKDLRNMGNIKKSICRDYIYIYYSYSNTKQYVIICSDMI